MEKQFNDIQDPILNQEESNLQINKDKQSSPNFRDPNVHNLNQNNLNSQIQNNLIYNSQQQALEYDLQQQHLLQQNKSHKRGYSQGIGASPASYQNQGHSPTVFNQQEMANNMFINQQFNLNPTQQILFQQLSSQQQMIPSINLQPGDLKKLFLQEQAKMQNIVQQQQLIQQKINQPQNQMFIPQQSNNQQSNQQNFVPPPGLSPLVIKPQQVQLYSQNKINSLPINLSVNNQQQQAQILKGFQQNQVRPFVTSNEPIKAFHNLNINYQQEQDVKVQSEEKQKNQDEQVQDESTELDNYKKQRRRQVSKSLDITSKEFIPTKKVSDQQIQQPIVDNQLQNQDDIYQQYSNAVDQSQSQNIDFKVTGRLKFFNESQSYGFIVSDIDGKDLFFHYDDMKKTNLSKQFLKDAKNRFIVRVQFRVMAYYGKYNLSKKAVDIDLLKIEPLPFSQQNQQVLPNPLDITSQYLTQGNQYFNFNEFGTFQNDNVLLGSTNQNQIQPTYISDNINQNLQL